MNQPLWLWQQPGWPDFVWTDAAIQPRLRKAYDHLGQLKGKMSLVAGQEEFTLDALLANIVASSAIESEKVDVHGVRSSLARQLGVADDQPVPVSAKSEGLASIMREAVTDWQHPLTYETLCRWHTWLFQGDEPLLQKVAPGELRGAAPRVLVEQELARFIQWFNESSASTLDPLVRAGITHLWFVTIHPFEDGNGRLTRALTDRALAQADQNSIRLFAMSEAILERRSGYYDVLERTQKGGLDITPWLTWFVDILTESVQGALGRIERTVFKAQFWAKHAHQPLSAEQRKVVNRLLDGDFADGISAAQYQRVAKVSKATATRHLAYLVDQGLLEKLAGGGRSTRYQVK